LKTRQSAEKAHSPVEGCLTCHSPHYAPGARLLQQATAELCGQCHDAKEPAFGAKHLAIAAKDMNCVSCHDPHFSKDPKFFKAKVHAPFASGQCDSCHLAGKR
jgi:predicted CXXCH cytochrome family protein